MNLHDFECRQALLIGKRVTKRDVAPRGGAARGARERVRGREGECDLGEGGGGSSGNGAPRRVQGRVGVAGGEGMGEGEYVRGLRRRCDVEAGEEERSTTMVRSLERDREESERGSVCVCVVCVCVCVYVCICMCMGVYFRRGVAFEQESPAPLSLTSS